MNKLILLGLAFGMMGVGIARADIPLPPEMLTKYTVALGGDLSEVLSSTVSFQRQEQIKIKGHGEDGDCTTTQGTLQAPTHTIVCNLGTYCRGHVPASCTVTFVGIKGQSTRDMVQITKQERP
jgi:hypothetical protein